MDALYNRHVCTPSTRDMRTRSWLIRCSARRYDDRVVWEADSEYEVVYGWTVEHHCVSSHCRRQRWTTRSRSTTWVITVLAGDGRGFLFGWHKEVHFLLQFPALRLKHVFIRDEVGFLKRINAMLQGGSNNLQVHAFFIHIKNFSFY